MNRDRIIEGFFENFRSLGRLFAVKGIPGHKHKNFPTRAQTGILMAVAEKNGQNVKDLAQRFRMSSSAATQFADELVREKLLTRTQDAGDHRKIILTLSKKGRKRMEKAKKERLAMMKRLFEPLTDAELIQLHKLQQKILDRLYAKWNKKFAGKI